MLHSNGAARLSPAAPRAEIAASRSSSATPTSLTASDRRPNTAGSPSLTPRPPDAAIATPRSGSSPQLPHHDKRFCEATARHQVFIVGQPFGDELPRSRTGIARDAKNGVPRRLVVGDPYEAGRGVTARGWIRVA